MKSTIWNKGWIFSSDIDRTKRLVDLPHDAMQTEHRYKELKDGAASGFYPGGIYTYEKKLMIEPSEVDQTIFLEFEGIYMNSSVFLNGQRVGGRIYGYSDFYVDLTGKVKIGENEIKVIADNSQCANSRWYSGSGIYRDVILHRAGSQYLRNDCIKVTTLSIYPARIRIEVSAAMDDDAYIGLVVSDHGIPIQTAEGCDVTLEIPEAVLWSADRPYLYEVTAEIREKETDVLLDAASDIFGIRILEWDAENGFQVNGQTVKLRGGCVHHDNGFIGSAEYDDACMRRISTMKKAGFNAVRIAHNPASKAMLRACDQLGMYVLNETFDTWFGLKSPYDYAMYFEQEWRQDLTDMIRLSYNHPSVILYSIGNEVYLKDARRAAMQAALMTDFCHALDATRPVTNCVNPGFVLMGDSKEPEKKAKEIVNPREEGKGSSLTGSRLINTLISYMSLIMATVGNEKKMRKINDVFTPLDIIGLNYGSYLYAAQENDYPGRVLVGTETFPKEIYKNWKLVKEMPWLTGDFLWTAWDYLGEAGIGTVGYLERPMFTQPFPTIAAGCANIDLTGEITPQGYYTAITYGTYCKPYIAVHPVNHSGERCYTGVWRLTDAIHSWNWQGYESRMAMVDVYSNAYQVELFINGKSLGKKNPREYIASFDLPYEAGELKAIAYSECDVEIGMDVLYTSKASKIINVKPEKDKYTEKDQLIYLPIELIDDNGVRNTFDDRIVTVSVSGPAHLLGLGNADLKQESLTPYTSDSIETHEGRALAIIRLHGETGLVKVRVTAEDLPEASLEITIPAGV